MKTILTISLAAGSVIAAACGHSGSASQTQEQAEITGKQALFADTVKPQAEVEYDFENDSPGQLPEGWTQYYTGSGGTDWKIAEDQGNRVLAQEYSDNPNAHFNIVVNDRMEATDIELSVRLKGVTGKHDQGGGFVWRFQDKNNYYVVRANPLEDNVVLYKVENGKRTDLPLIGKGRTYGADVPPLGNGWNTLRLAVKGDLFTVFLNGKELFTVQDSTFTGAGKVGLWTKADAVTWFDDFMVKKFK
ncbi:MAG TPA: family 16 glycoside hydrolase [Anseongella sp.]